MPPISMNLHLYPSPMTHESRIAKETKSIASFSTFDRIVLVGTRSSSLPDDDELDGIRTIVRLARSAPGWLPEALRKTLGIIRWSANVLRRFWAEHVDVVNCHSLSVLPLGVLLKWRTGARLVYDPHELETEANGLAGWRRAISKLVERALYGRVDEVIVVGNAIADWYQDAYGGPRPTVVLNCPPRREVRRTSVLRDALGLPQDATVFLYQGILGPGRGIELLLDAFSSIHDPCKVLVFLGMGALEKRIASVAATSPSVRLHPAVPPDALAEFTASADVGMCLIEDTCLSYHYCMPNKLFEYLGAGVPAVVSNLPEIAAVVERHGAGWVMPSWSAASLRSVLHAVDCAAVDERRSGAFSAAREYSWEAQVPALRAVYERLGFVANAGR